VIALSNLALYQLVGGGRLACLQGLVTCDVQQPGDGSQVFGALLTAKGMIVAPLWITRTAEALLVAAPAAAADAVAAVFARSLPPRLCRWEDVSGTTASVGIYGPAAADLLGKVVTGGLPADAGRVTAPHHGAAPVTLARVASRGLDGFECVLPAAAAGALQQELVALGAVAATPALLEERRVLSGFPRLGAEIDDKTLPQEVRLDELGGVSYTKGCYLGQETVARVHFRGHANRHLLGLGLEREPAALPLELFHDGQSAGRLSSACWWEAGRTWVGLAVVRRAISPGGTVALADGAAASVHDLPWEPARPQGAA